MMARSVGQCNATNGNETAKVFRRIRRDKLISVIVDTVDTQWDFGGNVASYPGCCTYTIMSTGKMIICCNFLVVGFD